MTKEEKARRYDKVVECAKIEKEKSRNLGLLEFIDENFPELKESEDEKIRNYIRSHFQQHLKTCVDFTSRGIFTLPFSSEEIKMMQASVAWLEKQGEQKPADKVEPKFKVGDTIRLKDSNAEYIIESISDSHYYGKGFSISIVGGNRDYELVEKKPTEWSEEDEKLFNRICDLIHEAAYENCETNEDGKELGEYAKMMRLLKFLKDCIQPKQEWSEEDENNILFLASIIEECFKDKEKITLYSDTVCAHFTKEDVIDRLKSLRPQNRWKPSYVQMEALWNVYRGGKEQAELATLYNDLKKLRRESYESKRNAREDLPL